MFTTRLIKWKHATQHKNIIVNPKTSCIVQFSVLFSNFQQKEKLFDFIMRIIESKLALAFKDSWEIDEFWRVLD